MSGKRILVTGALGQIGTELTDALRVRFGAENVLGTSRRSIPPESYPGAFAQLDVTDGAAVGYVVEEQGIDVIYHLAAILSAVGEGATRLAWKVNTDGLYNVLEAARQYRVSQVFRPSSIAV